VTSRSILSASTGPLHHAFNTDPARPFRPNRVQRNVNYLVAHEIEVGRWQPLGVIEFYSWEQVGIAIARLDWQTLPGVFRLVELDGPDWFELELAADGVVVEP
jgi:hypothetical protein